MKTITHPLQSACTSYIFHKALQEFIQHWHSMSRLFNSSDCIPMASIFMVHAPSLVSVGDVWFPSLANYNLPCRSPVIMVSLGIKKPLRPVAHKQQITANQKLKSDVWSRRWEWRKTSKGPPEPGDLLCFINADELNSINSLQDITVVVNNS